MKFTDQININSKDPIAFEKTIKQYLHDVLGFTDLEETPIIGDYGADLLGKKEGCSYVIQVKCYNSPVNLKAVQEVVSAISYYEKDKSMVITNSTFTETAIKLAESTGCILIDGTDLDTMYNKKFPSFDEQIEYLKTNKLRSFVITNKQLVKAYDDLKKELNRQPTSRDMDKQGDFSATTYKKRFGSWNKFLKYIVEPIIHRKGTTDEELVDNFNQVMKQIERTPRIEDMKVLGKISVGTYARKYGSYNDFLKTQGIEVNKKNNVPSEEIIKEFKRVKKLLKKVPTMAEFKEYSELSSQIFQRLWGGYNNFLKEIDVKANHRQDITNDELILHYEKLKTFLSKESLTQSDMNIRGNFCSSTYERRWGSWNLFLKSIGDLPNINTDISKKDLLDDYHRIREKTGKNNLSAKDIQEHSKYSISTYVKKFGSWNQCKEEASKNTGQT